MPHIDPHEEMKKAKKMEENVKSITSKQKMQGYDDRVQKTKKSKIGWVILLLIIVGLIIVVLSKNPNAINDFFKAFN